MRNCFDINNGTMNDDANGFSEKAEIKSECESERGRRKEDKEYKEILLIETSMICISINKTDHHR